MPSAVTMNEADLKKMWDAGWKVDDIAKHVGCSPNTITNRVKAIGLTPRNEGRQPLGPRKRMFVQSPPQQHKSAVNMPAEPLQDRRDWPDLQAAVARARGCPAPVTALGQVAARFRLPYAVVKGLADRPALAALDTTTMPQDATCGTNMDQGVGRE